MNRNSVSMLVRNQEWDDYTPSIWFPSCAKAHKYFGFRGLDGVARGAQKTAGGGWIAEWDNPDEPQCDLPADDRLSMEEWRMVDDGLQVSNRGRACIKKIHWKRMGFQIYPKGNPGEKYAIIRNELFIELFLLHSVDLYSLGRLWII